jgi:hypothetical protein
MTTAPPRPDAPLDDNEFALTIDDVAGRYARAGHPCTIRRLQKYCARDANGKTDIKNSRPQLQTARISPPPLPAP